MARENQTRAGLGGWRCVGAGMAALLLLHCQGSRSATEQGKARDGAAQVTLAEGMQPICAPVYVGADRGFFKNEALDVTLVPFSKGKLCLDAVLGGKADMGTVAETPLMHAGFSRAPLAVLCTIHHATQNTKCIARRDKGIARPEDLKGHRLGVPVGGNAEYLMDKLLQKHGLGRSDVTVVNLNPPEMLGALERGDIDAAFSWEPFVTRAEKALGDKAVVFFGGDLYEETFNIVALRPWVRKNPQTCVRLIKALIDATAFIHDHQAEAIPIVARHVQLTPDELSGIWSYYHFDVGLDQSLLTAMSAQAQWAIGMGTQQGPAPDYSYMLAPGPLTVVDPARVHLAAKGAQ